jgi:hypothetical protein
MLKRLGGENVDYMGRLKGLWPITAVETDEVTDLITSRRKLRVFNFDKLLFSSETSE